MSNTVTQNCDATVRQLIDEVLNAFEKDFAIPNIPSDWFFSSEPFLGEMRLRAPRERLTKDDRRDYVIKCLKRGKARYKAWAVGYGKVPETPQELEREYLRRSRLIYWFIREATRRLKMRDLIALGRAHEELSKRMANSLYPEKRRRMGKSYAFWGYAALLHKLGALAR